MEEAGTGRSSRRLPLRDDAEDLDPVAALEYGMPGRSDGDDPRREPPAEARPGCPKGLSRIGLLGDLDEGHDEVPGDEEGVLDEDEASPVRHARGEPDADRRLEGPTEGKASGRPDAKARHSRASGQEPQRGARGRQMRAPSSMRAWLWSPGERRFRSAAAAASTSVRAAPVRTSPGTASSRARTRATFPSTTAAGTPNAMEATAAAVYGPDARGARAGRPSEWVPRRRARDRRAARWRFRARAIQPRPLHSARTSRLRGGREGVDGREAGRGTASSGDAGCDRRLLEDHLGTQTPRRPGPSEREVATLAPVPAQQRGAQRRHGRGRKAVGQRCPARVLAPLEWDRGWRARPHRRVSVEVLAEADEPLPDAGLHGPERLPEPFRDLDVSDAP